MNAVSSEKRKYELKARAEAQERTREKIAAAAAGLHEERGVARTTVADIARRAGVQRLTVYNHFPELSDLIPACNAHYETKHPFPDLEPALALAEPAERVRGVLAALYGYHRETSVLQRHIHSDRAIVPEVDAFLSESLDAQLDGLADQLVAGFKRRGGKRDRLRAVIRLALEFWTWSRLDGEGLGDEEAADLMTSSIGCVAAD
jgi:AcrR family transcriptional regulator